MSPWHPVLRARDLRARPVRVRLGGDPVVLFRTATGIGALRDTCPHRAASLSKGRVNGESIACPYHGWEFDRTGRCTRIPLHEGDPPNRAVPRWHAREEAGLIYLSKDGTGAPHPPVWDGQPAVTRLLASHASATLADAVENVLDPVHTLFVHKGLIRGAAGPTSRVTLSAGIEAGELVMRYHGEANSNGLLSRLLEPERSHAVSRFRRPGMVSLEYHGRRGLNLVTTLWFTETGPEQIAGFAQMRGPRQGGLGWLKAALFVPIMRRVIAQDLAVMADATANWVEAGRPPHAIGPLDLLRPLIERVIAGETGDVAPVELVLDL